LINLLIVTAQNSIYDAVQYQAKKFGAVYWDCT